MYNNEIDIRQDPTVERIFNECLKDTGKYAKTFYPDRFNKPFTYQHDELFKTIDARVEWNGTLVPKYNRIAVKGWRGLGKTSIVKTIVAKRVRYIDSMLIVYIGKSHDFASLQTEAIKRGMLQNPMENQIFGPIKAHAAAREVQETFSKKAWVTSNGVLIVPRGCQQPVRGLLHDWDGRSYRIGLIIIDDLEDMDVIGSEDYRDKTKNWLLSDVIKAVPLTEVDMNWQIIYIDTLKHEDSTLQMLVDSDDWKSLEFAGCTEDYESLVPDFVSTAEWKRQIAADRERGTTDVFYREYMGLPHSKETATFKAEYFKYYDEMAGDFKDELLKGDIENVILVDPAKTTKKTSADSAVVGVGVNTQNNRLYVRDIVHGKFHPDELYDHVFSMAERLRPCHVIGIEVTSLDEYIEYPFRNAMLERGLNYEIVKLKPRRAPAEGDDKSKGKAGRVGALEPLYRKGQIFHNPTICGSLESQLLSFPRPKRWDVMDAFAYVIQLLEEGLRYFEPMDEDEDPSLVEQEYRELEKHYDEPLEDWRPA